MVFRAEGGQMPSAEASHSRVEARGPALVIGVIARLAAPIVAIGFISWLIRLSDVGSASVLLGTSSVVIMVVLLGFGYWWALSRTEESAAFDEQPELPRGRTLTGAARDVRAARRRRQKALAAFQLAKLATEKELELSWRERNLELRESGLRSHESWVEVAQFLQEVGAEAKPPQKRRRGPRRQKGQLATPERGN
jgi:hypothetical protein